MVKKEASGKTVVSEVTAMSNVESTGSGSTSTYIAPMVMEAKGIQIFFDERQIPQITFSGAGERWSIRDILHVKRLLTREYKRYLRRFIRKDVKKEETR